MSGAAQAVPSSAASSAGRTTINIWIFVLVEALIFGSYFGVYMLHRIHDEALFLAGQAQLSQDFGFANTLILITSSWFMARSVLAAREGRRAQASRLLAITMLLGVAFIASKIAEWSIELGKGFTVTTNDFFSFYYFLTAIHVLHVLIGFVFLTTAAWQLRTAPTAPALEAGAIVWHMIDFLWVIIFALLYVMR